ncbi:unnamed protein product [Moneuplotes crassus]|uniref:EF-hand domain-containing protein n=1 Tax=Euplotes crassus TaxID=5936 RepID=A0AAD1UK76_EUPCR|nr:unnamed protein product [Moneuplotes crassus]
MESLDGDEFEENEAIWKWKMNQWLKKRGKSEYIDFDIEELKKLRYYFDCIDEKNQDAIGVSELEDPLIALGLVDNRDEVQKIVNDVDDDNTGMIEFNEFLEIIKIGNSNAKDASDKTVKIYNFFKSLTTGKFNPEGKELIFKLFISKYRREQILNSMMSKNPNEKKIGTKILNNYRNQLAYNKGREQIQNLGQDKGHLDGSRFQFIIMLAMMKYFKYFHRDSS